MTYFVIFDVVTVNGISCASLPLRERLKMGKSAFGSKMVNLHDLFKATQVADKRKSRQITAWVASGELLLLLSIIIYLYFASFDDRCKLIAPPIQSARVGDLFSISIVN